MLEIVIYVFYVFYINVNYVFIDGSFVINTVFTYI